ncbi:MAG TPA: carbohydrate binding domain-containing protein [Kiritimatiellia bacterium]
MKPARTSTVACGLILTFVAATRGAAEDRWQEGFESSADNVTLARAWSNDASDDGAQALAHAWEFKGSNCLRYTYTVNNSPSGVFMDRAVHKFEADQDWSGCDKFTFHFKGEPDNSRDQVYFELRDAYGGTLGKADLPKDSTRYGAWSKATIDISGFRNSDNGTSLSNVRAIVIGVNAGADYGAGVVYFDNMSVASSGQGVNAAQTGE